MNRGSLIIVSGPSGSGKDTVLREVLKKMPDLDFSISSITRDMRVGEVEGEKYNFIYNGNYYGTPKAPVKNCINKGGDIILEVDVNGAENVRKNFKDCFSVFIASPSCEFLRKRLTSRVTETQEVIEKRLAQAKSELSRINEYDYIVVNDDLSTAVEEFVEIIRTERRKVNRNLDLVNNLKNISHN